MKRWVLAVACLVAANAIADELEDYVHKQRQEQMIPGLVLATIKEGKVDRVITSGKASLDLDVPVKRHTVFEIGSMTKAFTAELVMMLVEEGKVSLSDPIKKYIDGAPETWDGITVRHLLTHTSGLPNYTSLRPSLILNSERMTFTELFDMVKDLKLTFEPGKRYAYSNTGYYFLGHIIEKSSGAPLVDFLRERILKPLEMNDTAPQRARGVVVNRAVGYMRIGNAYSVMQYLDASGAAAAGFLLSTVDDLAKWDKALLDGKLLKPESYAEMYKNMPIEGGISTYGFGWDVSKIAGHRAIQHGGGTGGFSTYMLRLPDDKLTVVVLGNLAQSNVGTIAHGAAKILLPELVEKVIRDPDPAKTKAHKELIEKIADGTIQRTPFEEKTAEELFPSLIAQARSQLVSFGKLEKFELLEHKHEPQRLTRRYRMTFEKETIQLVIGENGDGKIVAIFVRPD